MSDQSPWLLLYNNYIGTVDWCADTYFKQNKKLYFAVLLNIWSNCILGRCSKNIKLGSLELNCSMGQHWNAAKLPQVNGLPYLLSITYRQRWAGWSHRQWEMSEKSIKAKTWNMTMRPAKLLLFLAKKRGPISDVKGFPLLTLSLFRVWRQSLHQRIWLF